VKTVLLVCAGDCRQLKTRLARAGCAVLIVHDGPTALARARHEKVDAFVLASTGTEMDLTETALNLRDVHPSAELILLAGSEGGTETAADLVPIARALPKTQILTADDLSVYLASSDRQAATPRRRAGKNCHASANASIRRNK
jgi:DNA-binding NtrC family response regulator